MSEALWKRLRDVLTKNCLWLEPLEDGKPIVENVSEGPINYNAATCGLALRVRRRHKGYRNGRLVIISERRLDEAVESMMKDPKFKIRCSEAALTVYDIEEMIRIATYGTLRLGLYNC